MMADGTGYIQLQRLLRERPTASSARALRDLTTKGMKRLVLDIRGNPGGPLDQAIKVSNRFLQEGRPDRLHARPHPEFRPGLPRASRAATTPNSRSSRWPTAAARARRRS